MCLLDLPTCCCFSPLFQPRIWQFVHIIASLLQDSEPLIWALLNGMQTDCAVAQNTLHVQYAHHVKYHQLLQSVHTL